MSQYPITHGLLFWLRRNLICRWFHRRDRVPTMLTYKKFSGLAWFCSRCYDWRRVDQLQKVLDSRKPPA